jgi:hypothetical protein
MGNSCGHFNWERALFKMCGDTVSNFGHCLG